MMQGTDGWVGQSLAACSPFRTQPKPTHPTTPNHTPTPADALFAGCIYDVARLVVHGMFGTGKRV